MSIRPVALVAEPTEAAEAVGVRILRSLGSERLVLLDPFLLLDHLHVSPAPEPSLGFPRHPHRGIETLTYVVKGWVKHRDSLGSDSQVGEGGVQWMRAGSGIFHEEYLQAGEQGSEALQVWFNLPAAQKLTPPEYQAVASTEIPEVAFPGGVSVQVVAGELSGVQGPVTRTGIQATYLVVTLPAGTSVHLPAPRSQTAFAYVYQGSVHLGEREVTAGHLAIFADEEITESETEEILATAPKDAEARFILVCATPLREPVFQYRSSVMNTVSQIGQVVRDLENGTFVQ
ncbi:pirin family protein [Armatimonas sp.]|uniref:pirin family protein n=1 Tax=Armatimonas sp. TaxID=1872638 RepID=UPI00286D2E09|nr:pirin family protein [Armatimonas sp.]